MSDLKQTGLDKFNQAKRAATPSENVVQRYRDFLNYIALDNSCIDSINQQDLPKEKHEPELLSDGINNTAVHP